MFRHRPTAMFVSSSALEDPKGRTRDWPAEYHALMTDVWDDERKSLISTSKKDMENSRRRLEIYLEPARDP